VGDARIVDKDVETAKFLSDALCRGSNGGLLRDVELECAGILSDAFCGILPSFKGARPDQHGKAACCEFLCDLKTDSFVGPGNQGDRLVCFHKTPFFTCS